MDIGNQQRVIIVELEEVPIETPQLEPVTAVARPPEPADDWPLPLDINVEYSPVS